MPPYLKALAFVGVAVVLTGVTSMWLGGGASIGRPREAERVRHPAGFSVIVPTGWGASFDVGADPAGERTIRLSPDRYTGRRPSLVVRAGPTPAESPRHQLSPGTFQGRPAEVYEGPEGNRAREWVWIARFERPEAPPHLRHAMLSLKLPAPDDVTDGPWRRFLETFRIEAQATTTATTQRKGTSD